MLWVNALLRSGGGLNLSMGYKPFYYTELSSWSTWKYMEKYMSCRYEDQRKYCGGKGGGGWD